MIDSKHDIDVINVIDPKKKMLFIIVNVVGFIIYFLGGGQLLVYITIAILFFILGKFTEKTISFIKDYKLSLKINRHNLTYKDFENIKQENKLLKELLDKRKDNNTIQKKHSFSIDELEIN